MLKFFTTLQKDEIDSLAIGGFDGVHLAHQALLERLGVRGAMLVIHRGGVGLTPHEERCLYHDKGCIMIQLEAVKSMSAEAFVSYLEVEFPALKRLVVGYDFRFGVNRTGDTILLQSLFRGEVLVLEEHFSGSVSIHAQEIKRLLSLGKIAEAKKLLGRFYSVLGAVVSGQGLGKKELYATLNLNTGDFYLPKEGVYATRVMIGEKVYPSVSFIGKRVSSDGAFAVETHLLDMVMREEVKTLRLVFVAYLRENRKFETLRDLKVQISLDIQAAKIKLA